jgi:glycosyltransferase involved in cell wall biosynthesis
MNLLLIPASYPYPASPQIGAQNERCARVINEYVDHLVVISPRPWIPRVLALRPRWRSYASIPCHYVSDGIEVYRPSTFVVPGVMETIWPNEVAYHGIRSLVRKLQCKHRFDAILSFDLYSAGGLAWRLGRDLGIPASGWTTGNDIRKDQDSLSGQKVCETLKNLDLVFYQSSELLQLGAQMLQTQSQQLKRSGRHLILPRGVTESDGSTNGASAKLRSRLGVANDDVMVLYLGRIIYDKGLFGLVDVLARNSGPIENQRLVLVGANPAFDHTDQFHKHLKQYPQLCNRIRVVPACSPEEIWSYFHAADIFAFPSFNEGMPNSLLEAMITGLPSVVFDIPAIRDIIQHDREALFAVRNFDYEDFLECLVRLSNNKQLRESIGNRGRNLVREHFSLKKNMRSAIESLSQLNRYSSRHASQI